jgi:hypothetical protein
VSGSALGWVCTGSQGFDRSRSSSRASPWSAAARCPRGPRQHTFEKYLREAACFPIYDGGNMGMQRRRVHGILASPEFNPRALMADD